MNENSNKYALAALKDKRAHLAGEIKTMKNQLVHRQEQLAHVDATIKVFEPDYDVESIPLKRPLKRVKLFRQGELGRLIIDVLRRAGKPLSAQEVVTGIMAVQGHDESARRALTPRIRGNLAYLQRRGVISKAGPREHIMWSLLDLT